MKRDMDVIKSLYDQASSTRSSTKAKDRIERNYRKKSLDGIRRFGSGNQSASRHIRGVEELLRLNGGGRRHWATVLPRFVGLAVMTAGMQQASEYASSLGLEVAKAEKKYDREIELAEGNSYKVKKAEKQKEKEIPS